MYGKLVLTEMRQVLDPLTWKYDNGLACTNTLIRVCCSPLRFKSFQGEILILGSRGVVVCIQVG